MDFLKAEINRKRKALDDVADGKMVGQSRFIRQKDLMEKREREQREAQAKLDQEREEKTRKAHEQEDAKAAQIKQQAAAEATASEVVSVGEQLSKCSTSDIKGRLRALRQPITLFGETDDDRLQRLIRYMEREDQAEDEHRDRRQSVEDDDDDDMDEPIGTNEGGNMKPSANTSNRNHGKESDEDEDDDGAGGGGGGKAFDPQEIVLYSKMEGISKEKMVYKYFKSLLKMWEWDLNKREDHIKLTAKGKMETKTQKQCKDHIRPLFKACKRKHVEYDILEKLALIVGCCEDGKFLEAHEHYLKCAIGNAAWPIGLTMVGIHERSGREKISSSKVAHIMNNESQRKYLQSVKRLMTFAQTKRPDIPPSMKVR
jgi:pre-mRNA-splicing factor 18